MEQNVIGRGGFFFTINASRIESIGYRNFSQNWLKSILTIPVLNATCVGLDVIEPISKEKLLQVKNKI